MKKEEDHLTCHSMLFHSTCQMTYRMKPVDISFDGRMKAANQRRKKITEAEWNRTRGKAAERRSKAHVLTAMEDMYESRALEI